MISFDFSRSAPPELLRRALELRIPQQYHAALIVLIAVAVALAGAWGIESHRLRETLDLQSVYQQRYDASERAVKHAGVYEERVKSLVALAVKIRSIRSSGYADARRLAEIANALPRRAWLTTIAYDGDAMSLEGRAQDLRALSDVVRGLTRAQHLRDPALVDAAVVSDPPQQGLVKYVLRVESGAK